MKKFVFTLQSVLNVKLSLEKQQLAELGECEARLRAFRREMEALRARLEGSREAFRRALLGGETKVSELPLYAAGFRAIDEKIDAQERKIETAEEERRRVQARLLEVMQERKMLEKLREKQMGEYRQLQKAEDAVMIDDFLTNKVNVERR